MKKTKLIIFGIAIAGLMTSCVSTSYMITDNPVGNKVGTAKANILFGKNKDFSIEKAASSGGIKKIGTVETKIKFIFVTTTVTGE